MGFPVYLSCAQQISLNKIPCELSTGYTSETLERMDSGNNVERLSLKNMRTQLKFEKTCGID